MDFRTVLVDHSWTMEAAPEHSGSPASAAPSGIP
jgi:hypothetical protein